MELAVLCLSFVLFLVLGVPVAYAIGLSCIATFFVEGLPFATAIQMMVSGMNVFSFLAIPFFIFSGELMLHGGIADKIMDFARSLVGHMRGGLGLANVMASTLFGGVSGSPVADTSAMGGVMIPIMKREGYSADYAVNVTTHASLTGALMPTSHNMIIYAFAAQAATGMIGDHVIKGVSIGDLMFAGLIPVFWIMVCMLAAAYWQARQKGFPKREDGSSMVERFPGWNAVLRSFIAALPGLMVIAVILGCVMGGVTTATEAAAIAVTYSLLLTTLVYRSLSRQAVMKALGKAARTTGVILLLIGVSNMLRWQMANLEIPDVIEQALLTATKEPWLMLLYINLIQIFLGIFLDMAAHILITTPLFLPLAIQMGVGPVQFVGCAIGGISIDQATKTAWPYYLAIWVAINLVTYVPAFSTWLPSLITGHPVF